MLKACSAINLNSVVASPKDSYGEAAGIMERNEDVSLRPMDHATLSIYRLKYPSTSIMCGPGLTPFAIAF